jgi:sugar lactone lactonase YvrE
MSEIETALTLQNELGEGPLWSVEEQVLYWVDIKNHCYFRYHPATGDYERTEVGVPIGVLAQRTSGGLVMAAGTGFAFWDTQKQTLDYIAKPEEGKSGMRFNDGAVDCRGRFWAGSMNEVQEERPDGTLYRLDPDRSVHIMETGLHVSNGIGWSPDNTIMYLADSPSKVIYAYDFDAATGAISNRRNFVYTPDEPGVPDGLVVDSEGCVWCARWDGAKITRYSPTGKIEREIQIPALRTTACVFGGANLDELYITSARTGLSGQQKTQYPLSGDLFRLLPGIRGLEKFKFAG